MTSPQDPTGVLSMRQDILRLQLQVELMQRQILMLSQQVSQQNTVPFPAQRSHAWQAPQQQPYQSNEPDAISSETQASHDVPITFIENAARRQSTFYQQKAQLMKQAYELGVHTGAEVMVLVASRETGDIYSYATQRLQPIISTDEGKSLIQRCLNAESAPTYQV